CVRALAKSVNSGPVFAAGVPVDESGGRLVGTQLDAVADHDAVGAVDAGIEAVAALQVRQDAVERGVIDQGGGCGTGSSHVSPPMTGVARPVRCVRTGGASPCPPCSFTRLTLI